MRQRTVLRHLHVTGAPFPDRVSLSPFVDTADVANGTVQKGKLRNSCALGAVTFNYIPSSPPQTCVTHDFPTNTATGRRRRRRTNLIL